MSKIIPPLLSSSPPPMVGVLDEDEDDDFGDFAAATNISYGCDALSLPSPTNTRPQATSNTDNSSNGTNQCVNVENKTVGKDFQDKRKEDASNIVNNELKTKICNGTGVKEDYNGSFPYFSDIPPDIVCDNKDDVNSVDEDFDDFQDFTTVDCLEDSDNPNRDDSKYQLDQLNNIEVSNEQTLEDTQCINLEPSLSDVLVSPNEEFLSESFSKIDNNSVLNVPSEINEEQLEYFECEEPLESPLNEFDDNQSPPNETIEINPESEEVPSSQDLFNNLQKSLEDCTSFDQQENDDFGAFESTASYLKADEDNQFMESDNMDFGDFENHVFEEQPGISSDYYTCGNSVDRQLDIEDDDDFNDFTAHTVTSVDENNSAELYKILDRKIACEKAKEVVMEMFPPVETVNEDFKQYDYTVDDVVFGRLKDITDTYALSYQWGKSTSQKSMLKALNIDTRNILYGPRWNESIPRYAATLGFQPLEPVKSDAVTPPILEPTPVASSSLNQCDESLQQVDIPSAQFDWVSAGLTNPLENSTASTMLLDLEQLVATLDIQYSSNLTCKTPNSSSPMNDNDEWDFWLSSATSKVEPEKIQESSNYDSVYLTSNILSKNSPDTIDFDLSPTVEDVNEIQNDSESVKSLQLTEKISEDAVIKNEPPVNFPAWQSSSTFESDTSWSFNPTLLRETHITNNISLAQSKNLECTLNEVNWLKPNALNPNTNQVENSEHDFDEFADFQTGVPAEVNTKDSDDEFTDFQSTLPSTLKIQKPSQQTSYNMLEPSTLESTVKIQEPLQQTYNMLEPLKATILQPIVSLDAPASINWPDPGVADIDLQRFELNYKIEPNIQNEPGAAEENKREFKSVKVNKSLDEDDWSDFVSNQGEQNFMKNSRNENRIVTPELQRPLHHLTEVQTVQQSVPIVTQQNVFQTKVLSNFAPLVHNSVQHVETYPQNGSISNHFHQDFISRNIILEKPLVPETNSFQSKQIEHSANSFTHSSQTQSASNKPQEADEEWSDFVSSQPMQSSKISNKQVFPPKLNFDWNKPPQFTSWSTSVTPNIITNPGSFDSFQSYSSPVPADLFKNRSTKKTPNVVIQPNRGPIQSISSVPDLEFISSKNKTWKK